MTGCMLADKNFFIADATGNIISGPIEDKARLRKRITDKVVIIGYNTWKKDISNYPKLIALPSIWLVISTKSFNPYHYNVKIIKPNEKDLYNIDYCLGGPKTLELLKPYKLIISQINTTEISFGYKLEIKDYSLVSIEDKISYKELTYELKKDEDEK